MNRRRFEHAPGRTLMIRDPIRPPREAWRIGLVSLLLAMALAAGPEHLWASGTQTIGDLQEDLRGLGLDPSRIVIPGRMTDEMRAWARKMVPLKAESGERLRLLVEALLGPEGLDLEYERGYSGTAQEVFERRKANCLGFATLLVAMSRELEIDAYYVRVKGVERFTREGDLIVVSEHVTAGYSSIGGAWILDFLEGPSPDYRSVEPMSDLEALALYYSNRGAELLLGGDHRGARDWLEVGVRLAPSWARIWTNLGVAQRRLGNLEAAGRSYRRASEADPNHLPAYSNLLALLRLQDRDDAVKELMRLLDRRKNRNPFIALALGDLSLEAGRLREAKRFYRRGVALGRGQPEPLAAMGQWSMATGRGREAEKWLRKAEAIDAESPRVKALRYEIDPDRANA